ncbi:MAG TPA: hypothetical protein V6D46_09630 [Coleofasciculaceae cyanobacterium]
MKPRRVFTQIWRINALIILVGGLAASGLLVFSVLMVIIQATTRSGSVENVVNVSRDRPIAATTELGNFERIDKTAILRAPLYLVQDYDQGYGGRSFSKEANSTQNYLFFDEAQKITYWLKPQTTALILAANPLTTRTEAPAGTATTPPVGFLYLVVEADTNNDKRLTDADRQSVAISDASGLRFKPLIPAIDRLNGYSAVQDQQVSILYTVDNALMISEINLQTQTIVRTTKAQTFAPAPKP